MEWCSNNLWEHVMTKWLRVHEAKGSTKQRSRQTTEILTVKPLSSVPRKSDHFKHWCLQLSYARLSYHQIVNLQAGARSQIAHVCLGLFVGSDERKTAGWRVSRRGATKVVTAAHIKADGTRSFHQCRLPRTATQIEIKRSYRRNDDYDEKKKMRMDDDQDNV